MAHGRWPGSTTASAPVARSIGAPARPAGRRRRGADRVAGDAGDHEHGPAVRCRGRPDRLPQPGQLRGAGGHRARGPGPLGGHRRRSPLSDASVDREGGQLVLDPAPLLCRRPRRPRPTTRRHRSSPPRFHEGVGSGDGRRGRRAGPRSRSRHGRPERRRLPERQADRHRGGRPRGRAASRSSSSPRAPQRRWDQHRPGCRRRLPAHRSARYRPWRRDGGKSTHCHIDGPGGG